MGEDLYMSKGEVKSFVGQLAQALEELGWQRQPTVVAISGGPDSVALLRGMVELATGHEMRLAAAHFNHLLRGSESDEDERFVRALCQELRVPLEVGRPGESLLQLSQGSNLEGEARRLRYQFLRNIALTCQAPFVLTAHTADDQVETILDRILRGTGIRGLAGINPVRPLGQGVRVIRPMLRIHRIEVLEYLRSVGQVFREDWSNTDLRFMRNRIRHELLPLLEQRYRPKVREAILRLGELAGELFRHLLREVGQLEAQAVLDPELGRLVIRTKPLRNIPDYLVSELLRHIWLHRGWSLRDMTRRHWMALTDLVRAADAMAEDRRRISQAPKADAGTIQDDALRSPECSTHAPGGAKPNHAKGKGRGKEITLPGAVRAKATPGRLELISPNSW